MNWVLAEYDPTRAELVAAELGVSNLIAILIAQRTCDHRAWFSSKLSEVPNPFLLPDVGGLVSLVRDAQVVGIFSDYDVDGVTSATMWREFLSAVGKQVHVYIPDREAGYGPNSDGIKFLERSGAELVLFLDCGTDKREILSGTNLPVAVIDHHVVKSGEKPCDVFINPQRTDVDPAATKPFLILCTAGLSFLLIAALTYKLRLKFEYRQLLDLAAIGTVADMMLLEGVNRVLVRLGLEAINLSPRTVIQKLLDLRYPRRITAQDIGFTVAPKINAAGRMKHAYDALKLFDGSTDSVQLDQKVAEINQTNMDRREVERRAFAECLEMLDTNHHNTINDSVIVVFSKDWHAGVIGIMASKLKERYHKPAFVLTECGDVIKGSARSTACVDLGKWIQYATEAGVIDGGGGHRAAGGVTMRSEQLPKFFEFATQIPHSADHTEHADVMMSLPALISTKGLEVLEPFGNGNPAPRVWVPKVRVASLRTIKDLHAAVSLTAEGCSISVMAFGADFRVLTVGAQIDVILAYKGTNGSRAEYTLAVARRCCIE